MNNQISGISLEKKYFLSIIGLYLFSLGSVISGYSIYIFLESFGIVEKSVITWNGQGLFWFVLLFCFSLFILFIPVEFFNTFKLHISTFKDLILNVVFVIIVSLTFLIFFQFALNPENLILFDVIEIGKALSFSGFISVPLVLFIFHNLVRNSLINESLGYSLTLIIWIMTSQIFL